jgi:hypothetical protein
MNAGTAKRLAAATALAFGLSFGGGTAYAQSAGEVWAVTHDTGSIAILEAYIEAFPDTAYARLAGARIKELRGEWTDPPAAEPVEPGEAETEDAETQEIETRETETQEAETREAETGETRETAETPPPPAEISSAPEPQVSEPKAAEPEMSEPQVSSPDREPAHPSSSLDVETAELHLVTTGADYWNHSARGGTVALIHGDGSLSIARTGAGKATRLEPEEPYERITSAAVLANGDVLYTALGPDSYDAPVPFAVGRVSESGFEPFDGDETSWATGGFVTSLEDGRAALRLTETKSRRLEYLIYDGNGFGPPADMDYAGIWPKKPAYGGSDGTKIYAPGDERYSEFGTFKKNPVAIGDKSLVLQKRDGKTTRYYLSDGKAETEILEHGPDVEVLPISTWTVDGLSAGWIEKACRGDGCTWMATAYVADMGGARSIAEAKGTDLTDIAVHGGQAVLALNGRLTVYDGALKTTDHKADAILGFDGRTVAFEFRNKVRFLTFR